MSTPKEWQESLDYALNKENGIFDFERNGKMMSILDWARRGRPLSEKQTWWANNFHHKVQEHIDKARQMVKQGPRSWKNLGARNFTFRVAWHDDKWSGHICNNPKQNRYCSGFHSLLSERLRQRKFANIDIEEHYKGQKPTLETYMPPCFWGINIFGDNNLEVLHDNPADKRLQPISELLPPRSLFSWPFSLSFTRSNKERKEDGAYPRTLEPIRVPKFLHKVQQRKSIAFIYTNYSNPLTEEEQRYLVVGCGLIAEKGDTTKFGPQSLIHQKRRDGDYKYFPEINWAVRFSLMENPVRIPYHEYLDFFKNNSLSEESKRNYLKNVTVSISEPELQHCFKYVAMDIGNDEAIYILSKIYKSLLQCENDGIVDPTRIGLEIDKVKELLRFCWSKRTYFPGFSSLVARMLNLQESDDVLNNFLESLILNEGPLYYQKFIELISNPGSDGKYSIFELPLLRIKDIYESTYGLTDEQFIRLCFLNLNEHQFDRILKGSLTDSSSKDCSIEEIADNPYLLCEDYYPTEGVNELTGEQIDEAIPLFKVDIAYFPDTRIGLNKIKEQYAIKNTDEKRLRALILWHLASLESSGNCFADAEDIENAIKEYPLFYNSDKEYNVPSNYFLKVPERAWKHFEQQGKLKLVNANETTYYYLTSVFNAEQGVSGLVISLLSKNDNLETYPNLQKYIADSCQYLKGEFDGSFDIEHFTEERKLLYQNIFSKKFFALTGNAGSGKSYELLNIVTELTKQNQSYLLLTPTGKAAQRLQSDPIFPSIKASTIDKIFADLETGKITVSDLRKYNNIVVDEMSMVDLLKFHRLLQLFDFSIPAFKRLILVGDPNQLPAIGYGKVLRDVLYFLKTNPAFRNNYIELQVNCRNTLSNSKILDFSEAYVQGGEFDESLKMCIASGADTISPGFRIRYWRDEETLQACMDEEFDNLFGENSKIGSRSESLSSAFKQDPDGGSKLDAFQIISPYNGDYWGVIQLNERIQNEYRNDIPATILKGFYKHRDKIIRTRNYYVNRELRLSNGSVGEIHSDGTVHFPELMEPLPLTSINASDREFFELAYAITVHKSQGSGFDHTFFILPKSQALLSKELIYTAITRSKRSLTLFIQGEPGQSFNESVLEIARRRTFCDSRKTTLLLDKPFRYYNLEADGKYIESRVELIIYQALRYIQNQGEFGEFQFMYEEYPTVNGEKIAVKVDFTIVTKNGNTWYWEHLGRLGNRKYEWVWENVKLPTYRESQLYSNLITTDELNGINPSKINDIITLMLLDKVQTEDKANHFSDHHYSLR